jgi:hypothetical protein
MASWHGWHGKYLIEDRALLATCLGVPVINMQLLLPGRQDAWNVSWNAPLMCVVGFALLDYICLLAAVLLQGDVYVKRRSGQGVAVYATRCAELGITPCSQVGGAAHICQTRSLCCKALCQHEYA